MQEAIKHIGQSKESFLDSIRIKLNYKHETRVYSHKVDGIMVSHLSYKIQVTKFSKVMIITKFFKIARERKWIE